MMVEIFDIALRVAAAAVAGTALGLNRWLHHKSAGVKTHALVAIASCLAVLAVGAPEVTGEVSGALSVPSPDVVSRVLQGLITGIGFLGAGVIMRNDHSKRVQGLTTAASIWATTVLGAAFGLGQYRIAVIGLLAIVLVLLLGTQLENWLGTIMGGGTKSDRQPEGDEH